MSLSLGPSSPPASPPIKKRGQAPIRVRLKLGGCRVIGTMAARTGTFVLSHLKSQIWIKSSIPDPAARQGSGLPNRPLGHLRRVSRVLCILCAKRDLGEAIHARIEKVKEQRYSHLVMDSERSQGNSPLRVRWTLPTLQDILDMPLARDKHH